MQICGFLKWTAAWKKVEKHCSKSFIIFTGFITRKPSGLCIEHRCGQTFRSCRLCRRKEFSPQTAAEVTIVRRLFKTTKGKTGQTSNSNLSISKRLVCTFFCNLSLSAHLPLRPQAVFPSVRPSISVRKRNIALSILFRSSGHQRTAEGRRTAAGDSVCVERLHWQRIQAEEQVRSYHIIPATTTNFKRSLQRSNVASTGMTVL